MSAAAHLIRTARRTAGLTQAQLADRAGTTQAAIARLEAPGSNPTLRTLDRVLHAADHRLTLDAKTGLPPVDESQIVEQLKLSPAQRLRGHDAFRRNIRELVLSAGRGRGGVA